MNSPAPSIETAAPPRGDDRAQPAPASQPNQRTAWIVIKDSADAQAIAGAMRDDGWLVQGIAHGLAGVRGLLAPGKRLPDVLVIGLRFDDGDGLQLIRTIAGRPDVPAVFIASHQQRAVIEAAAVLAEVCRVPLAGIAEQPDDAPAISRALAAYERKPPTSRATAPEHLGRDKLLSMFDRGALVPWMQPKLRIDTREVVGFEALMRAHDEKGQLVMPDRLVCALAANDLLDEATMRMAKQTMEFVATCLSEGMAVSASINVSMQSLANFAFCQELTRAAEQIDLDPSWITIEITETDAMSDLCQVIENTARIRMLGFNLAIDDFGTAYSSLFQLSRIPFSELKIERAFVSSVDRDAAKQAIVRACALLGNSLGLHVVAEGVETAQELAFVRECGCTQVQGYLVARPMPAKLAIEWLRGLDDMHFAMPA